MTIPRECKRLAEVDFPIAVVSKHAAKEKSIRHGHPSTLHLWWARRPLASCRAMLLALLLPDPCDEHCPAEFRSKARDLLLSLPGASPALRAQVKDDAGLRKGLLTFIGDFANWELAADVNYLRVSRGLVQAAHPGDPPLVVDPFSGGGSIPLEALRLGCDAFASDLNPVACLILKVLLEDIPRHGPKLAEELRKVGAAVRAAASKDLAEVYPADPDGARPIAYLWARTVRCESPTCGAEIPLMRSFWLCKKAKRRRALKSEVVRKKGRAPEVVFSIFEPKTGEDVAKATVSRAKATCLACRTVLSPDRVRAQLRAQSGGANAVFDAKGTRIGGALMLAVVLLRDAETGRTYRLPGDRDYQAAWKAARRLQDQATHKLPGGQSAIPDEPTPAGGGQGAGRAFSVQKYGMLRFADLFTSRQMLSLVTLAAKVRATTSESARVPAALAISKLSELANSLCAWEPDAECPRHIFGRQALPIAWDFGEGVMTSASSGSFEVSAGNVANAIESIEGVISSCSPQISDARMTPIPEQSAAAWFTDPPYYDAVPYSDLSDFFFVWLKRALPGHPLLKDPYDNTNPLTPKLKEMVQDETKIVDGKQKDAAFFEKSMGEAFATGCSVLQPTGIGSVVFAHKSTEGWEALLSGLIRGGWTITASWPIATEMGSRLRARDSAALATSIHLVCRPRSSAATGDWADVLRELPGRVSAWMQTMEAEGVRGADLVFACIGPALEIFSRFAKVEKADGSEVTLAECLPKVWEVVGRAALTEILGGADGSVGLEEDARLTALFLWTLQSTSDTVDDGEVEEDEAEVEPDDEDDEDGGKKSKKKGFSLPFDVVRRFAQPLGIHLDAWNNRIIDTDKGVVRLLPVAERAKQLFGESGTAVAAARLEAEATAKASPQLLLFPDLEPVARPKPKKGSKKIAITLDDDALTSRREATTLDRIHAAMLLQQTGRTQALRNLLAAEQDRGPAFLRLANSLSALYPTGSEEERLLDAMLLAVPK